MASDSGSPSTLTPSTQGKTRAGGYFVSNYPPFGAWSDRAAPDLQAALAKAPTDDTPLGLYVHIPFCRKRCHFCYFKVYTDKNAAAIGRYLDAVITEAKQLATQARIANRPLKFVYFGGGTPSYLSLKQLDYLFAGLREHLNWQAVEEVAFECEPGTLNENKLAGLKALGVTRLSLGVENFNEHILEVNNRAHDGKAIDKAYHWARDAGFDQINIDLIAGMLEETEGNWHDCVSRALKLEPQCITIYQMEIPFNTAIYKQMHDTGALAAPVADWPTKRRWVTQAFGRLEEAGYQVTSAYTAVRDPGTIRFVYRDALWRGADMLALGVSSFGHLGGVHYQNEKDFGPYLERVEAGEMPVRRAYALTDEQCLIRELVLQFKLGHIDAAYFRQKFNVDITERFADVLGAMTASGALTIAGDGLTLSRDALLRVDSLLIEFFEPEHRPDPKD